MMRQEMRSIGFITLFSVGLLIVAREPVFGQVVQSLPQESPTTNRAEPNPAKAKAKAEAAALTAQVKGWAADIKNDASQSKEQSLLNLMQWIKRDPAKAAAMQSQWIGVLLEAKRYEEIVSATTLILNCLANNSLANLEGVFPYRIQAQLKLEKPNDALVSAKQFYNICSMRQTASAVAWVCKALEAAHPDDATIGTRFMDEQEASASNTSNSQFDVGKPPPPGTSILDSVKVDATPYDSAADLLLKENYADLARRGNYALLADKPAFAKDYFERAYAVVPPKWIAESLESIARSIRALHRSAGPANLWIQSLKASAAPASAGDTKVP